MSSSYNRGAEEVFRLPARHEIWWYRVGVDGWQVRALKRVITPTI